MVNCTSSSTGVYYRWSIVVQIQLVSTIETQSSNQANIRECSCVCMLSKQIYAQIRHDVWDTKRMDQQGSNGTVLENSRQTETFEDFIEEALLLGCVSVNQKERFAEFWRGEMGPFGIKQMGWGTMEEKNVYLILRYSGGGHLKGENQPWMTCFVVCPLFWVQWWSCQNDNGNSTVDKL